MLCGSVAEEDLSAAETGRAYKSLSRVERAFRCLKTTDLHVRPIFHRLSQRVQAHVFLSMPAYYVDWHMRRDLAPLLFAEDDPHEADWERRSPVQPAVKTALAKAIRQKTDEGYCVQDFRGLVNHLSALTLNTVRPPKVKETIEQLSEPADLHREALELLQVPLCLRVWTETQDRDSTASGFGWGFRLPGALRRDLSIPEPVIAGRWRSTHGCAGAVLNSGGYAAAAADR